MYDRVITVDVNYAASHIPAWTACDRESGIKAFGESREAAESRLRDEVEKAFSGERLCFDVESVNKDFRLLELVAAT